MAYNTSNRSERLLQGRRFTTDNLSLTQEAFTDVFDLGAGEIFTDDGLIPTGSTQLAYSGSSQNGEVISGSVVNPSIETNVSVLRYHYRKKLKQAADGQREVYYFTTSDPSSVSDTVTSDQLIESDQQTNFVSPKYIIASDSPNNTESSTPGYKVVVYKDTASSAGSISSSPADPSHYVFDFKTGVLTWISNAPASNQFVYITAYQYIGRTLRSQIDDGSIGGGGSDLTIQEEGSSLSTAATTLNFVGNAVTATGNGATKTITINTAGSSLDIDSQTDGTGITVEATDKLILSDAGTEKYINVSQLPFTNDTNTFRTVRVEASTNSTLGSSESLVLKQGSNITLAEDGGTVSISGTPNTQLSTADVRGKISGTGLISYNSSTGVISTTANNYVLPEATATSKGGIELFSNTDQTVAANAVSATAGRTYGLQLNSDGQAVVNVPWSNTNTNRSDASVYALFSGGDNVQISDEGVITATDTNTQLSTSQVRSKISGTGLISYNSSTGVISTTANNYSLPAATSTVRGGIELISNTAQTVAANSVTTTASRTYGLPVFQQRPKSFAK